MDVLFFTAGIFLGALSLWLILKSRFRFTENIFQEREQALKDNLDDLSRKNAEKDTIILNLTAQLSASQENLKNLQSRLSEQKQELDVIQKRMQTEFENLANRILDEKSRKFSEQHKESLEGLLKPLSEKIKEFREKMETVYGDESRQRFHLGKEIEKLVTMNQQLSDEARNLTRALKGESKTQGNWGEMILESLLEKSGLVKDREYEVQVSRVNEEGKRVQPDILVRYPGNRALVIDSKVSLTAYERYVSAETDQERDLAIREHLLSVRKHVQELAQKNYAAVFPQQSLDYVMMFMPIEPAYYLALQNDAGLWAFAYERGILLMSPTNLLAALKLIESIWRNEYQNRNAQEIAKQSGDMLDKFISFVEDLNRIGDKISDAQKVWSESVKKLSEGKGNLINRARSIQKLGAKSRKNLPAITGSDDDEEENLESKQETE